MYTTNSLFKVETTHKHWFNMDVRVMNVDNHLDVYD